MGKTQTKLSQETAATIEAEMNALMQAAQQQLEEWKESLKGWANQIKFRYNDAVPYIIESIKGWIDQIRLDVVKTEMNQVQIVYDMPDEFVQFVSDPPNVLLVPQELIEALKDSHVLDGAARTGRGK